MKPIKFRAWHSEQNKMYSAEEMGSDELTINPDGRGFVNVGRIISLSVYLKSMIPMQFTGILDKNGKEIYEGDIVEYENSNCGYGRNRSEELTKDVIPEITSHEQYIDKSIYWINGEVIGNRYENPELLEQL
jgi:uncharacterized phage protein (TIGR01671 family)